MEALTRAVRDALPQWSLSPRTAVVPLGVSENVTFLLDDAEAGRRMALRVHRPGYHTEAEIRSELAWIAALRGEAGFPTPAPVPGSDGDVVQRVCAGRRIAVAFEHVSGREPGRDAAAFRALGILAARLHRHARTWRPPPRFVRKTWDFETMLGRHPVWGDWRGAAGLGRAGAALLERAAEALRAWLAQLGTGPDRFGLIHADLRLANLLADGQALTVIDFDDCGFGWFAYDFAASTSFFEDDPAIPEFLDAWLGGYAAVAPLAPTSAAAIPAFVMLRRLLLLAWITSHPEAAVARELRPTYATGTLALAEAFLSRGGFAATRQSGEGRANGAKTRATVS